MDRALDIRPYGTTELARCLKIPVNSVFRILRDQMLVLDMVSPEVSFYFRVVPGSLVYYHPNAYGKAVLAFMGEKDIKQVLPSRMTGLTPNTIVLRSELLQQLELTRRSGLAYDNEGYTSGIQCIGAPVFDVQGKAVAGLGVTCLLSTIDAASKSAFALIVLECAWRVSKDIGYSGDFFAGKVRSAQPDAGLRS